MSNEFHTSSLFRVPANTLTYPLYVVAEYRHYNYELCENIKNHIENIEGVHR